MAQEHSFDVVSDFDHQEMVNAVDQTRREIQTRYDFKGITAELTLEKEQLVLLTEGDMQLRAIIDVLQTKLHRRGIDLKVLDPERHLRFTGVPLAPILRNLRALDATGAHIWLRMPLVPGYNDDRANLEAVGTFAADLRHARRLHVLPYHRLGAEKYARLGRADPMGDVPSLTSDAVETAAKILGTYGLDVHVGG